MTAFKNFKIWRGRLPHWRADDVRYYVSFRHRRPLEAEERNTLFRLLLRADGRRWNLYILCVLPEETELIFSILPGYGGAPFELSDIVESAKRKAGARIAKETGERYPPFYAESYDRIIRDDAELEERWEAIFNSAEKTDLVVGPQPYETLWVADA